MNKPILFFLCLLFGIQISVAQEVYYNEWIDYDKEYIKLKVAKDGLHRINASTLLEKGLPLDAVNYKLLYKGREVPMYSSGGTNMGSNDYFSFVGRKNDGEFDTQLYSAPSHQPSIYSNLFTDTSAYYLVYDDTEPHLRVNEQVNSMANLPPKELYFNYTAQKLLNNTHNPGEPRQIASSNSSAPEFTRGEGYTSSGISSTRNPSNFFVPTPAIYLDGENATVDLNLVGQFDVFGVKQDHPFEISVNEQLDVSSWFESYDILPVNFEVPVNRMSSPNTIVNVKALNDSIRNIFALGYLRITYPRLFDFNNANELEIILDDNEDRYLEIENFNGGNAPIVFDLTNNWRFEPIYDAANDIYKLRVPAGVNTNTPRRLYIAGTSSITNIDKLQIRQFTDYKQLANQGNYLIISHPSLSEGDIDQVARYAAYRSSDDGGNYQVVIADIEELYDQFAWGIRKHPLSIQAFIEYTMRFWQTKPAYLLLMGKAISYADHRNSKKFERCLVPTYGITPSDIMLTAPRKTAFKQRVATGRIPALDANEVRKYLDKVIEYEALQKSASCNPADRLWMKDALHIAGGNDLTESEEFIGYLTYYERLFEGVRNGGNVVHTYNKNSEEVIDLEAELDPYINNGLSMITFFGHSSATGFSVGLKEPEFYQNEGKYPFILTGSCLVGNIHSFSESDGVINRSLSEDYIFAEDRGAIGFLATATLGFGLYLDRYMSTFYESFCMDYYNQPIGLSIQNTINTLYQETSNPYVISTIQEYTYAGDPVIIINSWKEPEYVLRDSDVYFDPPQLSTNLDSFAVNVVVTNLGQATSDSVWIQIDRQFADGSQEIALRQQFPSTVYIDTISIYLPIGEGEQVEGENLFTVHVDYENNLAENCENNNSISKNIFVLSDLLLPLAPCDYAIVNNPNVTLYAATGQPILESLTYIIEIDTSQLFTNPIRELVTSKGGVIQWQPNIAYQNNKVYYWRTSKEPDSNGFYNWQENSFIFMENGQSGWSQSHYYQFQQDTYNNLKLDSMSRQFEYQFFENQVKLFTDYDNPTINGGTLNGGLLSEGSCLRTECGNGITFFVFRPGETLEPIFSVKNSGNGICDGVGSYGNTHCTSGVLSNIEFNTEDETQLAAMVEFIENTIQDGYYVGVMSVQNHHLQDMNPAYRTSLLNFFTAIGIPEAQIYGVTNNQSFLAWGQKNRADYPAKLRIGTIDSQAGITKDSISLSIDVRGADSQGTLYSPTIGPSVNWEEIVWDFKEGSGDNATVEVRLYAMVDTGQILVDTFEGFSGQADISNISASVYPFLRLEARVTDEQYELAPQLNFWRIHFDRAPEIALSTKDHYVFESDTINQGGNIHLEMGLWNVEATKTDSVLIAYTIINSANQIDTVIYQYEAPILPEQMITSNFNYETVGLSGSNMLQIEINPNKDQAEKMIFNNLLFQPFFVTGDAINPLLDVTVDGRHIIDGELISAKPTFIIQLNDENGFLPLDNPDDFNIVIKYPDENGKPGEEVEIPMTSDEITFIPATIDDTENGKNTATIEYRPCFEVDGLHQILVSATDRSGNKFSGQRYEATFEIATRSAISKVLNYPNPFSSSTQFVFFLTGSEVPEYFKIQIMTASGKVVKEIMKEELGDIHVGQNMTDYAWDGTDTYGNQLANGVYLYRVITRNQAGGDIEEYTTNADSFFKNNIGKMYLMR